MNRKIAKSLSALLLLTAIAVTQVPVSDVEAVAIASDFEMDGNKLVRYTGTDENVSVPVGVKSIGEEAFAGNDNIIKVEIGNQVESVGYRAFAECDNLRTITVGDEVEEIEPELSVEDLLVSTKIEDEKEAERIADIDTNVESEYKKQIEKFISEKPDAVAQLLRNWLSDDWE